jgi:hypothetical protein
MHKFYTQLTSLSMRAKAFSKLLEDKLHFEHHFHTYET